MALLFAEHGVTVSLNDPSEETMDQLLATARKDGLQDRLEKHGSYEDLCNSLGSPKVLVFSLPHGNVGDTVVDGLHPYLDKGDIIIDASNENWENTQRRQGKLVPQYVQCESFPMSVFEAFCAVVVTSAKVYSLREHADLRLRKGVSTISVMHTLSGQLVASTELLNQGWVCQGGIKLRGEAHLCVLGARTRRWTLSCPYFSK